jgi:hypothetical protein
LSEGLVVYESKAACAGWDRRFASMADYHTTYKGPEGETTQWEDIQVKHGNFAPRAPKYKPPKYEGEQDTARDAEWLQKQDTEQLEGLEDAFEDDRDLEAMRCDAGMLQQASTMVSSRGNLLIQHC